MNSEALIYKVQEYRESSKLLFVYTPHGKYTLVARGAKNYKNNFFHLADYLNLIEVDLDLTKSMQTLKKGKLINSYENIKNDYNDFKIISKVLSVIDRLIVNIEHEDKIFKLILTLLLYYNKWIAYLSLLIKLTYALGYRLTFRNDEIKGFNLKLGRTISKKEDLRCDLNLEETLFLKLIYYSKEEPDIPEVYINKLYNFIQEYYLYHLDYRIEKI